MIRILIVDDTRLYREGLAHILAQEPDIGPVDTAADVIETTSRLDLEDEQKTPDVILLHVATRERIDLAQLASERDTKWFGADLTPREREIVSLIDQGLTNKEIAFRLSIAERTVKNHAHHIYEKLHVHRRGEATARLRAAWSGPGRTVRPSAVGA